MAAENNIPEELRERILHRRVRRSNDPNRRAERWVFTWNNYTPEDKTYIHEHFTALNVCYLMYGHEICPTTGTPHLQGFVCYRSKKGLDQVREDFKHHHVEIMKGSIEQNEWYCGKDKNEITIIGVPPRSAGEREKTNWDEIKKLACEQKWDEIDPKILIRHYSNLQKLAKDNPAKVSDLPSRSKVGLWVYGHSGNGKSFCVRHNWPDAYIKDLNQWWDGYKGEKEVILDDFDPDLGKDMRRKFKIWADEYAFPAETKGSMLRIRPEKVIVTSQYTIDECWLDQQTRDAMKRRFKEIHLMPYVQGIFTDLKVHYN